MSTEVFILAFVMWLGIMAQLLLIVVLLGRIAKSLTERRADTQETRR